MLETLQNIEKQGGWTSLKLLLSYVLLSIGLTACNAGESTLFFKGKDALLEEAINDDNATAIVDAIKQGANHNAVGLHGVTPIIVTAGNLNLMP